MKVNPDIEYAEANFPPPVTVAGIRLLPFQVGHKVVLQAVHSPFFDAKEIRPSHFIFALWVCSNPVDKAAQFRTGNLSVRWVIRAALLAFKLSRKEAFFHAETEKFFKYLLDAHARPKGTRKDQDAKPDESIAPSLMAMKSKLMGRAGYTHEGFMRSPLRLVIYDYAALAWEDGALSWPERWERGEA